MGEENGIPPQGFDLGNSPLDLTRDLIREHPRAVMAKIRQEVGALQDMGHILLFAAILSLYHVLSLKICRKPAKDCL